MQTNHRLLKFLSSRLFTFIVITVIVLVALAFYKNYQKQKDIKNELETLDQDIAFLTDQKLKLARLIELLESTNYIEREARLRLGLKKPEEQVISVPVNARPQGRVLGESIALESARTKPLQWFDYFFLNTLNNTE